MGVIFILGYIYWICVKLWNAHCKRPIDDDPNGEFTFCTSNGASVVDYGIASTDLFPLIHRLTVDSCDVSMAS